MIMKNSTFTLLLLISISASNAQSKIDLEIGGNYLFIDSYSELKMRMKKYLHTKATNSTNQMTEKQLMIYNSPLKQTMLCALLTLMMVSIF